MSCISFKEIPQGYQNPAADSRKRYRSGYGDRWNMENEAAVRQRHKKSKKNEVDFSLAVIHMQTIVCVVLLLIVILMKFFGGSVYEGIKQQCRNNIIGEFNFNEIVENTIAVFMSFDPNHKEEAQKDAAQANAVVTSQPADNNITTQPAPNETKIPDEGLANVSFDEPELELPQTMYISGESPLESDFLALGEDGKHILAEKTNLDEAIKGASLTEYKVATQGVLPTTGRISSQFGFRDDPFTGERKFHGGMDIATPIGTPIAAAYGGRVIESIHSDTGYGNHIIIQHADGLITIYGHCSKLLVETGTVVRAGEIIAEVGSTGNSTGPHLHFEARINGIKVSPAYLVDTSPLKKG